MANLPRAGWIIGLLREDCLKLIRGCGHLLNLTAISKIPMNTKMYFAVIICIITIRSVLQSQCDNSQSGLLGCAPTLIHCSNKYLCRSNLFFITNSQQQPKKSQLRNDKTKAAQSSITFAISSKNVCFQNLRMSESLTRVLCWLERKR